MKRGTLSAASGLVLGALLMAVAPALLADDDHRCSFHSVAGTYGYAVVGTRSGAPTAAIGLVILGSDGTIRDGSKQTFSFNGILADETLSGTYTVNADCTGSATVNVVSSIPALDRSSTIDIVWDNHSRQFRLIFTVADTVVTGDGRKLGD